MLTAETPSDALRAFVQAVSTVDGDAARGVCSEDAWSADGDTARRLFDQATRKRLRLEPAGPPEVAGDRAALAAALMAEGREAPVGAVWFLQQRGPSGWRIEAPTRSEVHKRLFLRGALPAFARIESLPASPDARAFADRLITGLTRGDVSALDSPDNGPEAGYALEDLRAAIAEPGVRIELLGVHHLDTVSRTAVGVEVARPGEQAGRRFWLVLASVGQGAPSLRSASGSPSLTALLEGVPA